MADNKISLTLSDREKFCLAGHMLHNVTPKNHEEGIRYYDTFCECELEHAKIVVTTPELLKKVDQNTLSNKADMSVSLSNATVTYLLEVLNQPMAGLHSLTLVPLSFRLRSAQVDYVKNKE